MNLYVIIYVTKPERSSLVMHRLWTSRSQIAFAPAFPSLFSVNTLKIETISVKYWYVALELHAFSVYILNWICQFKFKN